MTKLRADHVVATIIAFASVFAYVPYLSGEPSRWDTAEMQTVPYVLGIGHPTGFPLYTLLGFVYSHVVVIGSVAYRLNLFSALCMVGAMLALYACLRELEIPWPLAAPATLWLAFTYDVWSHATHAEIHVVVLFFLATLLALLVRWVKTRDRRLLPWIAAAFACGVATHPIALLTAPGLVIAMIVRMRSLRLRDVAIGCGIIALGALAYAYIPLRSAYIDAHHLDPTLGLRGVSGSIIWNDHDPRTFSHFTQYVTGADFGAGHTLLTSLVQMSTWQTSLWAALTQANQDFGIYAIILAIVGFATMWTVNRSMTIVIVIYCFAVAQFANAYASIAADLSRYRFLPLLAITIGMAAAGGRVLGRTGSLLRTGLVGAFLIISCISQYTITKPQIGSPDTSTRPFLTWMNANVPKGAIVQAPWLNATTLMYAVAVDGTFANRIIVSGWPTEHLADHRVWSSSHPVYVLGTIAPSRDFHAVASYDPGTVLFRYEPARATTHRRIFNHVPLRKRPREISRSLSLGVGSAGG